MCNRLHCFATTVRAFVIPILLSGIVWAQGLHPSSESSRSPDVFAQWHSSLSDAADRTLAAAVADRSWMKSPEVAADFPALVSNKAPDPLMRVRADIQRVEQLQPIIEPVLRQERVPSELSAIVLVESGGQIKALSPKGARGIWQLMPDTARRYGLIVTEDRDERIEVVKSTRAAARYLRDLYQRFGDWRLAFAAYNAGEQTVERAAASAGRGDFSRIELALPQETRNYVPAVLNAMKLLGGNPQETLPLVRSSTPSSQPVLYASTEQATASRAPSSTFLKRGER